MMAARSQSRTIDMIWCFWDVEVMPKAVGDPGCAHANVGDPYAELRRLRGSMSLEEVDEELESVPYAVKAVDPFFGTWATKPTLPP